MLDLSIPRPSSDTPFQDLNVGRGDFSLENLHPFGVRLSPFDSKGVNVQDWIRENMQTVLEMAYERGVIVVTNAKISPEQPWENIEPRWPGSFQFPHSDFDGKATLIVWHFSGKQRNPTAFVPAHEVVSAMQQNREILKWEGPLRPEDSLFSCLRAVYQNLCGPSEKVCINGINELNRAIIRDRELEERSRGLGHRGLTDICYDQIFFRQARKKLKWQMQVREDRELCSGLLETFHHSVTQAVSEKAYYHRWTDNQNAAIISYGRLDGPWRGVLHFAKPGCDLSQSAQSSMKRCILQNGSFSTSEPKVGRLFD